VTEGRKRGFAGLVVVVFALSTTGSTGVAAAYLHQRFFFSPSRNISCQMDQGKPLATRAYCQTFRPPQNATVYPDGRVTACFGSSTGQCLGDPPLNTPTLAYGRTVVLGPFRCASLRKGVRCVVICSGHGFLINRSGISHF